MGFKITKDRNGVEALKKLATSLSEQQELLNQAADKLNSTFQSVKDGVAHENEIEDILTDLASKQAAASSSIATLTNKLNQVAESLENFLNTKFTNSNSGN